MNNIGNWVVGVLVGLLLASILLPITFSNWLGADQSGWDTQWIALWAIVPIGVLIALVIKVFRGGGVRG